MNNARVAVTGLLAAAAVTLAGTSMAAASTVAQPFGAAAEAANHAPKPHLTPLAVEWAAAWNSSDPRNLAGLFVQDGSRYTDHAFDRTYTGSAGVAQWVTDTKSAIPNAKITLTGAIGFGDSQLIFWNFSGQATGAPHSFSVPAVTVIKLRGGKILTNDDYYSKAEVNRQSGLPESGLPSGS
ncbi:nuclear transport factor 2 family protein [Amycolatopsis saalfeldensis]|uniref:SnoaL-like domain-containing protein n=1 Tax=Amycolatopsis saalfeldensis TaxID=394193 RepID=A0A1H8YBS5_9PSEU|nr:nuclear transport factor 2 family protein [Amycolatopsis saalfeldensis]SEP49552.1 SnoaL-like domain-containing protein [Amycolatopsis saalfeldensis]